MKKSTKSNTIIKSICAILVVTILLFTFTACGDNKDKELVSTTETTIKDVVFSTEKEVTEPITEDETTSEVRNSTTEAFETEKTTEPVTILETTKKQEDKPITTKKQESTAQSTYSVTTTKPVTTTKAPETTTMPTTTEAEYYPSLTAADMEELKRYAISYIESKGYRADPDITWSNAGSDVTVGINNDLSQYGDKFKVGVGVKPLDWAKKDMKEAVDYLIQDITAANGPDSIYGMYPLVRSDSRGWSWTIGYW